MPDDLGLLRVDDRSGGDRVNAVIGDRVRSVLVPDRGASSAGTVTSVNGGAVVVHWDDDTYCTVSRSEITSEVIA